MVGSTLRDVRRPREIAYFIPGGGVGRLATKRVGQSGGTWAR